MKGKITKIEQATATSGKPYIKVWTEGRKNFTPVWDSLKDKWNLLFEGAEVEFKFHEDGEKYILDDIIGVDAKESVQPTPAMPQQATDQRENKMKDEDTKQYPNYLGEPPLSAKDKMIVREVCVKSACELHQGTGEVLKMLASADLILKWIHGDISNVKDEPVSKQKLIK